MTTQRMELLAPAGGMEQLKAALRFGADAIYGGLARHSLRAFAGNFDEHTLPEAVRLCHAQGARFYAAINALATDCELEGFVSSAQQALDAGVDAAIVADIGVAATLRKRVPGLPIHLSTQLSVCNAETAQALRTVTGARRVVLAREMRLEDILTMRRALPEDMALEAFVHGAMCVAYSGRCLLSAALTGRSANRGECAQPCRWRYHLTEEKRPGEYLPVYEDGRGTYLYSASDLCMIGHLDRLRDAGIASLKIEGRMKTAYYVATVVSAYRRALDLLEMQGEEAYHQAVPDLLLEVGKASHRQLSTGFYFGPPDPPGGAEGFSQTMEYVGDVEKGSPDGSECLVRLKNRFYVGDTLELLTPQGPRAFTVSRMTLADTGQNVETASVAGTLLRMPIPGGAETGDLLRGPNRNHRVG
ncbi:MAG: U32 family peptidase [Clostridiales bacterium]|nr:U32 family peptidase [Clostridiales bacterium]